MRVRQLHYTWRAALCLLSPGRRERAAAAVLVSSGEDAPFIYLFSRIIRSPVGFRFNLIIQSEPGEEAEPHPGLFETNHPR